MPDDIPHLPLRLAVLAVAFCLSAFFSGSETALFSFQPHELGRMSDPDAGPLDRAVAALRRRPKRLLMTILFGNMCANVVFYSVSYILILDLAPRLPAPAAVLLGFCSFLAVIIGGEVMPKNLAVTFYRPFGRAAAVPLALLQKLITPVVWPLARLAGGLTGLLGGAGPPVHAEELQMLVALSTHEGVVDEEAGRMIAEVIELSEVRVNELMVPRVEVVAFDLEQPPEQLTALFAEQKLSVVPAYEGQVDEMRGVIRLKDVLFRRPGQDLRELVRAIPYLPETATVEEALRRCRRERSKTAFVLDEYGAVIGLLTIEDLLEEIVGEIADEYEPQEAPMVQPLPDGRFRVQGRLSLRQWQDLSGVDLPEIGVDTVGGLAMALLDRVPEEGDTARCPGMELTVERVQERRAETLLIRLLPQEAAGEGEGG